MAKRTPVPEGKSVFFRHPELTGPVPVEVGEEVETTEPRQPTRQSAIFLEERHLDWLDDKCREARRRSGRAIRKAAIIRALLDVAMDSPVDLTSLRDEEELLERLRRGLRGG
ncbi:MAG: hypothetical protein ACYC3S_09530 [Chloroflexota bacterium]